MPSVYIKTYGCAMNERDSEAVAAQLAARGYVLAESEAGADVILLNTCSVRDTAEQKAIGKMSALVFEMREKRPDVILGFMGCMAQSRGAQLMDRLPDVDLVIGTQKFHRAAGYVDDLVAGRREKVVDVEAEAESESALQEHLPAPGGGPAATALVSIMQGCNQHCTFCIVPSTRGAERSRSIPDIVGECRALVDRGVREITLLGQIVTSFGRREVPVRNGLSAFVQLLEAVNELPGLERLRFTAPHPKGYGDDLVEAYGRLGKLVESAHIPMQTGSDRMLKAMHRGYSRARFVEIIQKLRAVRPGMGIVTDFIVGFPGETEEDFEETLSLARECQFDNAYIYKYSSRRDTPAAEMPGQLPREVKEERNARLLETVNEIAARRYEAFVGQTVQILVEGPSRKNPRRIMGRTRCGKIVLVDEAGQKPGSLLDVPIERMGRFTLYGASATAPA